MNEIYEILRNNVFYIATTDGDQPRVRPFGAVALFEGKIYIQTGKIKNVYSQLSKNPKVEICTMIDKNTWVRITAEAETDDRIEAREYMLEQNPSLKNMYKADDGNCEVLFLKNATATISSFVAAPRTIKF